MQQNLYHYNQYRDQQASNESNLLYLETHYLDHIQNMIRTRNESMQAHLDFFQSTQRATFQLSADFLHNAFLRKLIVQSTPDATDPPNRPVPSDPV